MSASFNLASYRSKLTHALRSIGTVGGHEPPKSSSNVDPLMHELEVASTGASFFEKRRKNALARLLEAVDLSKLDDTVSRVTETEIGEEVYVAEGDIYALTCSINKPSYRLDDKMLRNKLMREHHMTQAQVTALMNSCLKPSVPARRFRIVARG